MLAAKARLLFDEAKRKRTREAAQRGEGSNDDLFISGASRRKLIDEIRSSLKSYLRLINPPQSASLHKEAGKDEGLWDLVSLHRELAKWAVGEAFEKRSRESADTDRGTALETETPVVAGPASPVPVSVASRQSAPLKSSVNHQKAALEEARRSVPAFRLDRRKAQRKASSKPLFSVIAADYLALRETARGKGDKDVKIARARLDLFIKLIGDHPVDTYNGTDLQAFVELMQYWPGDSKERDPTASP